MIFKLLPLLSGITLSLMGNAATIEKIDHYTPHSSIVTVDLDLTSMSKKRRSHQRNSAYSLPFIKKVSIEKGETSQLLHFVFHGDSGGPAIAVKDFNINAISPIRSEKIQNNICLDTLQSHLEEYARKAILISHRVKKEGSPLSMMLDNQFFSQYPLEHFVLTNNCRSLGSFEFEWPGILKGHFQIPQSVLQKLLPPNQSPYNNYTEYRLTNFYYQQFIDKIKISYSPKDLVANFYSKYMDPNYRWISLGNFNGVRSLCLKTDIDSLFYEQPIWEQKHFFVDEGTIPYEEFPMETRVKSGHLKMREPLSYVKSPCTKSETLPPVGLSLPLLKKRMSFKEIWSDGPCLILPHRYHSYKDIYRNEVHLSRFDVDGVYSGASITHFEYFLDTEDEKLLQDEQNRMKFEFSYLSQVKAIYLAGNNQHLHINIRFKNGRELLIGNISQQKLKDLSSQKTFQSAFNSRMSDIQKGQFFLLGLASRPLAQSHEEALLEFAGPEKDPLFALFVDNKGRPLNHHDRDIGVEAINIKYRNAQELIIDLISHERILPVARYHVRSGHP